MLRTLIAIISISLLASMPVASEELGLVVYRDSTGSMTQQSRRNLPQLIRTAREEGTITVWVVFNIPFEGNPDLRTPEVVATEAIAKLAAFAEHITPLIESELVYEIDNVDELLDAAPGAMLQTTADGLRRLARDSGIKHIGHLIGDY